MKLLLISQLLLLLSAPAGAAPGAIPAQLLYQRTGKEGPAEAELAGKREVENENSCALPLFRDLEALAADPAMRQAGEDAAKGWLAEREPTRHLVLLMANGSLHLRFELREDQKALFRKEVRLSERPGTFRQRLARGECRVKPAQKKALIDLVAEPTRLTACKSRKIEVLEAAGVVGTFLHEYIPEKWVDDALERLSRRVADAPEVLRKDQKSYRSNNQTFQACRRGLDMLEAEAGATIRVLRDISDHKAGTELPLEALDALERLLDSQPKER